MNEDFNSSLPNLQPTFILAYKVHGFFYILENHMRDTLFKTKCYNDHLVLLETYFECTQLSPLCLRACVRASASKNTSKLLIN